MRLKYITKPVLISFLRWLDKNKYLHGPYRVRYSSFRSKRDMLTDFSVMFGFSEDSEKYLFTLRPSFSFLSAPEEISFDKTEFKFYVGNDVVDLNSRPKAASFSIKHGPILVDFCF